VDIYNNSFPLPASFGVIWWDLGGKIHGGSVPVFTYTGAANTAAMQALLQCAASCVSSCP